LAVTLLMVTYQAFISTYTYSPDDSASCSFNEVPFSEELNIHPPLQLGDQAGVTAPSDVISADQLGHLSASVEDSITGAQAGNADHTVSVDESHKGETSPMDQAYPDALTSDVTGTWEWLGNSCWTRVSHGNRPMCVCDAMRQPSLNLFISTTRVWSGSGGSCVTVRFMSAAH